MSKVEVLSEEKLSAVVGGKTKHPKARAWTFTGAGIAHSTLYGAAASALGVTGPAGWAAGAAVGAVYGIASAAFC
ncbi:MAG: Blp family class II bacteriocin [Lactobacillus crispatus]|jgi:hypothetical protein|uniref:Blp family class II bacteriocin n=1 Tax=Lactobacillus crispatus TaxID=47770 RepID=UPI0018AA0EB1|nr:Blp family class II bacteriocin [Lactobacillus crispatus]MCH4005490.1 Blp family class II bacteriocin [Lactobacillus crispatus]MCI1336603.1 Blp family class II bacteriocin [Lactobacillus crispatus]MCI1366161.1 Blp family class II bacteriocin [Lactobacillus crispatus]MCI1494481.1 Blp family class II bacteriocin [Lactobacillus crispatus]MCI1538778.1 Blp family class II bacteriocin [Lactobacillus crispatus]